MIMQTKPRPLAELYPRPTTLTLVSMRPAVARMEHSDGQTRHYALGVNKTWKLLSH
jgi:hypothetical protein